MDKMMNLTPLTWKSKSHCPCGKVCPWSSALVHKEGKAESQSYWCERLVRRPTPSHLPGNCLPEPERQGVASLGKKMKSSRDEKLVDYVAPQVGEIIHLIRARKT